jgi:hypothetical protein
MTVAGSETDTEIRIGGGRGIMMIAEEAVDATEIPTAAVKGRGSAAPRHL